MYRNKKGFTLIEVMIVVAIIGILSAIALPSYREYVKRGARTAGQNYLADLAQRQELRFQTARAYSATSTDFPSPPGDVSQRYAAPVFVAAAPPAGTPATFTITMSPLATGVLVGDGDLFIDSLGNRWRDMGGGVTKRWDE